jgi:hypothetical protein
MRRFSDREFTTHILPEQEHGSQDRLESFHLSFEALQVPPLGQLRQGLG